MIVIIHYLADGTDGVSLEIQKKLSVLNKLAVPVRVIDHRALPFLSLEDSSTLNLLKPESYRGVSTGTIVTRARNDAQDFELHFARVLAGAKGIYVHNLFSLPIKPAVSLALLRVIKRMGIPTIAINHDFWQTRGYFDPRFMELYQAFPPKLKNVKHQVINSLDSMFLEERGITDFEQIHDYWSADVVSFSGAKHKIRGLNLRKSTVFINASRIIYRKNIEASIAVVAEFNKMLLKRRGRRLQPGVLVLSNPEHADLEYLSALRRYARKLGVRLFVEDNKRRFWDWYKWADVVLYTTVQEGFGNQFLEAMHFGKPTVVFEYPVFRADIKHKGFEFISLGSKMALKGDRDRNSKRLRQLPAKSIRDAVAQILEVLQDDKERARFSNNSRLVDRIYGKAALERRVRKDLEFLWPKNS